MSAQVKVIGSIIVLVVLLVIQLMIEHGYIQYGWGHIDFVAPTPPAAAQEPPVKVWVWDEINQAKGKEIR